MSVKASWFQIGLSNTANLNFHWRNLLDGVLRLTRGNAGAPTADVMLVNADNSVSFPGNIASGVLGAGQTWQDVTGSRAPSTTYTNSTGRPIVVAVNNASGAASTLTVAGVQVGRCSQTSGGLGWQLTAVVPNGATYVYAGAAITNWAELR